MIISRFYQNPKLGFPDTGTFPVSGWLTGVFLSSLLTSLSTMKINNI